MLTATIHNTNVKIHSDFLDERERFCDMIGFYQINVDLTACKDAIEEESTVEQVKRALNNEKEIITYTLVDGKLTCLCSTPDAMLIIYPHLLGPVIEKKVNALAVMLSSIQRPYDLEFCLTGFYVPEEY
ncbi:hypothetical protein [Sporosarcina ureae]|uniref:hypothetical protein n=1 Tax=Sporosarcina ureae TaxID=1571 RepID=UPI000A179F1C|nr:hypothetical protein [Sporosarcina ureae]ARK22259.1 hypothetical protein SporoP32a_12420 [Sporosarcina ureae]